MTAQPAVALPATTSATTPAAQVQADLQASGVAVQFVAAANLGPYQVEVWRLANGLQVVLAPDPDAKALAVHTWVRVGSADEVSGKTGLAHLFEHLMFKATRNNRAGTLDRTLERWGSGANAATWLDWTFFHETIPPTKLGETLVLEADRLANLDLTQVAFASELDVVREERSEVVDNDPDGQIDEALYAAAYGQHPYGHPTIGWDKDLQALTLADAQQFYRQHYNPAMATLVLVGPLDRAEVLRQVHKVYGGLAAQPAPARPPLPAVALGAVKQTLQVEVEAERLLLAYRTVPGDHPDHPALLLLGEVLCNADSSRLQKALLFETQQATACQASMTDLRGPALWELRVVLRPGVRADKILPSIRTALAALAKQSPPTAAELASAKNRLKMQQYRELLTVDGRAETLGQALSNWGDIGAVERWFARAEAVTPADLQRVAKTWLTAEREVLLIASPRKARTASKRTKAPAAGAPG